jgi:hypothetical protein
MLTIAELRAARGRLKPLRCPHCREPLGQLALVIATRNCPGCGRRVAAEPDDNDDPPPFTREQLDVARAADDRLETRIALTWLSVFLTCFGVLVVTALFRDTIRDTVRPVMDPGWFLVLVLLLPLLAGATVLCAYLERAWRAAPKCLACDAALTRVGPQNRLIRLVRLTGNCCSCGQRVAPPLPDEPAGPPPSVGEFKASVARLARVDNIGGFAFLGLMLAGFAGFCVVVGTFDPHRFWAGFEQRHGLLKTAFVQAGLAVVWTAAGVGFMAAGFFVLDRRRRKLRAADPLLNCPHCRAALTSASLVIASRRCPGCLQRVLAEPDGVATDAPVG